MSLPKRRRRKREKVLRHSKTLSKGNRPTQPPQTEEPLPTKQFSIFK